MAGSDIIAAIATPPGRGGIGVIRISGKHLTKLAEAILGGLPKPRYACLSQFLDAGGQVIDQGIALYFPAPHSYTGEDVLELQGHGGPAVMDLLLDRCLAAGARLAQPGEFTLRAYLNNKIDLIQAESVAAIIEASTHEAARCAINSLQGHFSSRIEELVSLLIKLRMLIEATLDFPEDEIDNLQTLRIDEKLAQIYTLLEQIFLVAWQGNLLQEGIRIVLTGAPNVGKSSLLNQLVQEEAAIVTEIPGTTRDTIQRTISLAGMPIHIIDTAGLRETQDVVEQKGIERTHAAIRDANMVLRLIDSSQPQPAENNPAQHAIPAGKPQITVFNKIDLVSENPRTEDQEGHSVIYLSAKTGAGIELLRSKILEIAGWQFNQAGEGVFMARQRHLEALNQTKKHLENAQRFTEGEYQLELLAEELRLAQNVLSSITGQFTADDLLGEIFSHFCIGK
ncbi:tRNA uridine-5-carboxymethylaminomethyl(34) synthesis GTPase MnmE [Nitrosomonas sp. Is24]|uniref:tRNA uridine-5-carboxymethylaminomethyl(34) synthesis GTPase MnmE n=1 Tax=Nitrosomonas sp. Is24 TaxID=3080533 RepID=UPI00294B6538|nr:tRNA uridine-5-carboxymethylaminomethyl(34) synthesis GTPase MnmE [Nitrosomonas sp. Is24]MDV6340404.1 tRNA uridine-5-carboxymethylaminomethyl(34) synthesis GTPase MnmE [Nitrosomonas sp. Is24]